MSSPTRGADATSKSAKLRYRGNVSRPSLVLSNGDAKENAGTAEPFAKRHVKKNPLIHKNNSGDDGRETRRKRFLRRVREDSEDRRWQARGGDDELMRTIWIAEQKRRDERNALEAEYVPLSPEEEAHEDESEWLDMANGASENHEDEGVIAERMAQQEEDELEALLSMMDVHGDTVVGNSELLPTTPYGSDDEDYDNAFMEYLDQDGPLINPEGDLRNLVDHRDHEMMDLS